MAYLKINEFATRQIAERGFQSGFLPIWTPSVAVFNLFQELSYIEKKFQLVVKIEDKNVCNILKNEKHPLKLTIRT